MQLDTFCLDDSLSSLSRPPFLSDPRKSLVILFGSSRFLNNSDPIHRLCRTFPDIPIIGCSTAGEIFRDEIKDDSLVGAVLQFDRTTVHLYTASITEPGRSFHVGRELARKLLRPDLAGVLVLSDGLTVNGSELARGLNSLLPESTTITGGLAGDGDRFHRTWVIQDRTPRESVVSVVGFSGNHIRLGHGSKGGWDFFGPERRVTKSQGNVVFELDGKPALELYKHYLGERADGLPATALLFPLALKQQGSQEHYLVRTILAVDELTQSLKFAGDIPQGSVTQLMRGNFDRLIEGASQAAQNSNVSDDPNALAVAITCVGRRLVLGKRTEEELEATMDVFPPGMHQIGFYSYGELSPHDHGHCNLHNQTMTVTTITER